MAYPKHSEVLNKLDVINDVMTKLQSVKYKDDEAKSWDKANKSLSTLQDRYAKFVDYHSRHSMQEESELKNWDEHLEYINRISQVSEALKDFLGHLQAVGDKKSKEMYSGLRWMCNQFERDAQIVNAYRGEYPIRLGDLHANEVLKKEPARGSTFAADITSIAGFYSKMKKLDDNLHINSAEFKGMKNALIALANHTKAVAEAHGLVNENGAVSLDSNAVQQLAGKLTMEESMRMGELMDNLRNATQTYIDAKGIGNQRSTMGKQRMLLAVEMESFLYNNQGTYPSQERINIANEHVNAVASVKMRSVEEKYNQFMQRFENVDSGELDDSRSFLNDSDGNIIVPNLGDDDFQDDLSHEM